MENFLYQRLNNKDPKINVWFSYPAIENFAMASLGFLTIFKMLDLNKNLWVERVYSDTKTTQIPPTCVDCMGFSFSFEIDILTIIKMLKKYNFPLKAKDRKEDDPIIFAGGPVLMSNPIPYEEFFDFISIGEKTALKDAFEILKEKKQYSRNEILKKLSELKGIYVPSYPKEKIEITRDDLTNEIVYTPILSEKSYFQDTFIIELERGCPKMCNFCLASWINMPARFVPYEKIIEAIDFGLQHTNKIALLGAYVAGHPQFNEIIAHIAEICKTRQIELSISSLRADLADENLIKTLVKCNQKTATIALEAGSQRLRNVIKKDLTEEQVLKTIETAYLGGLKGIKIYVMIGLPTETDEDIEELINLVQKMKSIIKAKKGNFDITISASTFIPKANTPFETTKRTDKKTLEKRINHLKKSFHKMGISFRSPSIDWDIIQGILSRCDKNLGDFLIDVVEKGSNLGAFKQTYREYHKKGYLPSFENSEILPFEPCENLKWGFIDIGFEELKNKRKDEFFNQNKI